MEAEAARLVARGEESKAFTAQLIQSERRRRVLFPGAIALGVLALAAAVFVPRRTARPLASDEDARLVAAVGDPEAALEIARRRAATVLHVTPDAPESVIEAAFAAQLKDRDPATLEGLAPDLRRLVADQREELTKAREVLLKKR